MRGEMPLMAIACRLGGRTMSRASTTTKPGRGTQSKRA